jgi:Na+-transporting methylmalonyl-CoA/oxaloacetate decarboxylase beta subunit
MNKEFLVHLFHIIIIGGLFLYVGIKRKNIPNLMFPILFGLGVIVILYHMFNAYKHIIKKESYWISLIHILLVGPLLVYIGYNKDKTHRLYFELLLMLAFASIGYHGYYLILSVFKDK